MQSRLLSLLGLFILVSCGGGSNSTVPGELGQVNTNSCRSASCCWWLCINRSLSNVSNVDVDDSIGGNTVCAISGTITAADLTDDVIYGLSGAVNVGSDMGEMEQAGGSAGVLNIPAGVTVVQTSADYLVVQKAQD